MAIEANPESPIGSVRDRRVGRKLSRAAEDVVHRRLGLATDARFALHADPEPNVEAGGDGRLETYGPTMNQ
jgi:hypothetical protein